MTGEITPGCMESVESESWADYLLAGRQVLGTRALWVGGGVALEVPGDPSGSLNRTMGIGWDKPVTAGSWSGSSASTVRRGRPAPS